MSEKGRIMEQKTVAEILIDAVSNPKRVETAEGRVEERSVSELLQAQAALNQQDNQTTPWGMVFAQHIPTGEY